jgi:alkylhydroperoxidase family enzyme
MSAARIAPATPPFPDDVQAWLDKVMPPGAPPLALFATLARDPRLFGRFMSGGLLDRGNLTMRQREIAILRVTAQCGSEYEWGVHAVFFGPRVRLGEEELRSVVHGGADDACWSDAERLILRLCDELHATCGVSDSLWTALKGAYDERAILEFVLVAGFYRTVSYLTGALRIPLEAFGARFPEAEEQKPQAAGP